jgi:hypothetical protein
MDDQQQRRVEAAARKFAESLTESYRAVSDRTVSAQQLNAELTQDFFTNVFNNLRGEAESNREMAQQLADQQQRQQEATQALTQESVGAYMDFMNSMFSFHQGGIEAAERGVEEAERSAGAGPGGGPEGRQAVEEPPLEDYDSLNVDQISERLDKLSDEEIKRLRAYEVRNKNRRTLMNRLRQRIEAGSS